MMTEILNPFDPIPGYRCFGCAKANERGLRMRFFEDADEIVSVWSPKEWFEGYGGIIHGGIQASLHDEIASWVVFVKLKTAGFTETLETRYLVPVSTSSGDITLRSKLDHMDKNHAHIVTTLSSGGKICSESTAVYFTVPERIARSKFMYPGIDAFYAKV